MTDRPDGYSSWVGLGYHHGFILAVMWTRGQEAPTLSDPTVQECLPVAITTLGDEPPVDLCVRVDLPEARLWFSVRDPESPAWTSKGYGRYAQ